MTARSRRVDQQRREPLHPPVQRDVIHLDAAFCEEFFQVSVRQPVPQIPAHSQQNHLRRETEPDERRQPLTRRCDTTTTFHLRTLAAGTRSVNATEPTTPWSRQCATNLGANPGAAKSPHHDLKHLRERDLRGFSCDCQACSDAEQGRDQQLRSRLPEPTLPKGGTPVHGLGEKFSVDTLTGTATLSVAVATDAGRGASTAEIALTHHPGAGPSPSRAGLAAGGTVDHPQGRPACPDLHRRRHVRDGGDDLVPVLVPAGGGGLQPYDEPELIDGVAHRVHRYLPRTVTDHVRIERCRDPVTGDEFWRTVPHDNVSRTFGRAPALRVHDPGDPNATRRVAEWLLDSVARRPGQRCDLRVQARGHDRGGAVVFERHHVAPGALPPAGRYLKHVRYANAVPDDASTCRDPPGARLRRARPRSRRGARLGGPGRPVLVAPHRVRIRIWRRCRRIMVFHDFGADQGPGPLPRLVRTFELTHQADAVATQLTSIRQVGYDWSNGAYVSDALPPLAFSYGTGIARHRGGGPASWRPCRTGPTSGGSISTATASQAPSRTWPAPGGTRPRTGRGAGSDPGRSPSSPSRPGRPGRRCSATPTDRADWRPARPMPPWPAARSVASTARGRGGGRSSSAPSRT